MRRATGGVLNGERCERERTPFHLSVGALRDKGRDDAGKPALDDAFWTEAVLRRDRSARRQTR